MIRTTVVLLALLALFMLTGVIPVEDGAQTVVLRTPVFRALGAVLGVLLIVACIRFGRSWKRWPFWLAHLGVVAILAGAGLRAWRGVSGELKLPVGGWHAAAHLPGSNGQSIPLGFRLSVADFRVEHYDPTYRLYVLRPGAGGADPADYLLKADLPVVKGAPLGLDGYGSVAPDLLWDAPKGEWQPQVLLTNGWVLQRGTLTPSLFEAKLSVEDGKGKRQQVLRVNHPVAIGAWRVYLTSYGTEPRSYVQLSLRRDPGSRVFVLGVWMTIVGVALMCWRKREPRTSREGDPA